MVCQRNKAGPMTNYTCHGDVCGSCGTRHRSLRTALQCSRGHGQAVRRAYPSTFPTRAYSDRYPQRTDGEPFSTDEQAEINQLLDEG